MSTLTLPKRCDRSAAEALLPELLALVGSGLIKIDGSNVTQVSQAMLQLLLSARKSFEELTISASQALCEAASLAGVSHHLFDEAQS